MMTRRAKRELFDKLHRGFVMSMIGVTGICAVALAQVMYGIITSAKEKEKLMLAELNDKELLDDFPDSSGATQNRIK